MESQGDSDFPAGHPSVPVAACGIMAARPPWKRMGRRGHVFPPACFGHGREMGLPTCPSAGRTLRPFNYPSRHMSRKSWWSWRALGNAKPKIFGLTRSEKAPPHRLNWAEGLSNVLRCRWNTWPTAFINCGPSSPALIFLVRIERPPQCDEFFFPGPSDWIFDLSPPSNFLSFRAFGGARTSFQAEVTLRPESALRRPSPMAQEQPQFRTSINVPASFISPNNRPLAVLSAVEPNMGE